MKIALWLVRIAVGGVFLYAGVLKVMAAPQFALDISRYRLVPMDVAVLLAVYLPWVEILAGAGAIFRRLHAGSLLVLIALTLLFSAAIASAAVRGLDIQCGCFGGSSGDVSYGWMLARDAALLAGLVLLVAFDRGGGERGGGSIDG